MATITYDHSSGKQWGAETNKSTDYPVTAADSGTFFTASGAATFTLPSLALGVGCYYWFYNNADNAMAITAPSTKLIVDGNSGGTTGTYSTTSHQIGSCCYVFMNAAGTFWCLKNLGHTVVTVT